jgi:hypothetical protein
LNDPALLCVAVNSAEASRISVRLAGQGIAAVVKDGDMRVVLEFGQLLEDFLDVWVERAELERARAILDEGVPGFGALLLRELEAQGGREVVTAQFRYEGIQRLKTATRAQVLELFRGSEYELMQRIKKDPPADLARFLIRRFDRSRAQGTLAVFFLGAMLS